MPEVTRVGTDSHVGHASPTPNPFHQTEYATGSPDVFVNGAKCTRIDDTTTCGDPATAGSSTVFVNGKSVHRKGDATGGHGSFVANESASGSDNVIAGDSMAPAAASAPGGTTLYADGSYIRLVDSAGVALSSDNLNDTVDQINNKLSSI